MLDAAAGNGYLTEWLRKQDFEVTPVDLDSKKWKVPGVACQEADLNKALPFETGHFDVTISVETIEHLENPFLFLRELTRVTKPGGLVFVTTPNIHSIRSRLKYLFVGLPTLFEYVDDDNMGQHIMPVSMGTFLYAFQGDGVELVDIRSTGPSPSVLMRLSLGLLNRATRIGLSRARNSRQDYPEHYLNQLTEPQLDQLTSDVSLIVVGRKPHAS